MGSSATMTVRIPSPASVGGTTIILTNLDPSLLDVPASVRIPYRGVSLEFQVTARQTQGCARINASLKPRTPVPHLPGTPYPGGVTHTIRIVP
jgi:hypothetical protein